MVVAGCAIAAAGIGVAIAVARARARRENSLTSRLREMTRAWEAQQSLGDSAALPLVSAATARKLATALAVTFAAQFGRWSARRLLPAGSVR